LLGVATPSDLIQDKNRTPFNIGRAIQLSGFKLDESQSLIQGLATKASNPQNVLQEVLAWTGGQPFLTQKICQLVLNSSDLPSTGSEGEQVKNLVRSQVLQNWEAQDEPEHFKTIRERILRSGSNTSRLLGLYQLLQKEVAADDSPEQKELRLSGLVVRHKGKLTVYNRIYESIFNLAWVEKELENLRPYASSLSTWVAANCEDESRLLRGQALQDALTWANGKSLSDRDYQFLAASQELDKREVQITLEAERKANHILSEAQQKAKHQLKEAQEGTRIERAGVKALRLFEAGGRGNMLAKKGEVKEAIATLA
jgi:hypothetical protein